jgi:hypothetical protein
MVFTSTFSCLKRPLGFISADRWWNVRRASNLGLLDFDWREGPWFKLESNKCKCNFTCAWVKKGRDFSRTWGWFSQLWLSSCRLVFLNEPRCILRHLRHWHPSARAHCTNLSLPGPSGGLSCKNNCVLVAGCEKVNEKRQSTIAHAPTQLYCTLFWSLITHSMHGVGCAHFRTPEHVQHITYLIT